MNGTRVRDYLDRICTRLDDGRSVEPLRAVMVRYFLAPVAVPAALGLALAATPGCSSHEPVETNETACGDGADNDRDGRTDCADPDCMESVACTAVDAYGAPFDTEIDCGDGVDNDWDGQLDCDDSDCRSSDLCAVDLYGTAFL